jgi:hypothetical protein
MIDPWGYLLVLQGLGNEYQCGLEVDHIRMTRSPEDRESLSSELTIISLFFGLFDLPVFHFVFLILVAVPFVPSLSRRIPLFDNTFPSRSIILPSS